MDRVMPDWMRDMCDQDAIERALGTGVMSAGEPVPYANRAMATRPGVKQNVPAATAPDTESEEGESEEPAIAAAGTGKEGDAKSGRPLPTGQRANSRQR